MISKNSPTRNRVVVKSNNGTLLDQKPYTNNWKSVRSSLGLFFCNNFFFADSTLLVEGPSDAIYVLSMFRALAQFAKIDVDLNLFSIRDAGNSRDYVAMAKLMADEGRKVVALLDGDEGGNDTKGKLEKLNLSLDLERRVSILMLADKHSIENCLPYPKLYREAFVKAARELVKDGTRALHDGIKDEELDAKIAKELNEKHRYTLGKHAEFVSAKIFKNGTKPSDPLSKLHIARIYDDAVDALLSGGSPNSPENEAHCLSLCEQMRDRLGLKTRQGDPQVLESA